MTQEKTEERKKAFIVFASCYYGAMKYLTREEKGELFELLGKYSLECEDVHSENDKVDLLLDATKPNMDAAEKRHQIAVENGTKGKAFGKQGGRPRKNETGLEIKPLINPQITPNKPLNIDIDKYKDIEVDINKDKNKEIDKEINKNKDNNKNIDKDIERDKDRDKEEDNTNKTINQLLSIISQLLVSSNNSSTPIPNPLPGNKEQATGNENEKGYNPNYALIRQIRDDLRRKAKQDNTKRLDEVNSGIVDEIEVDDTKLIDSEPTHTNGDDIDLIGIDGFDDPDPDECNVMSIDEPMTDNLKDSSPIAIEDDAINYKYQSDTNPTPINKDIATTHKQEHEMSIFDYNKQILMKKISELVDIKKNNRTPNDTLFYQAADLYMFLYPSVVKDIKQACQDLNSMIDDVINGKDDDKF